MPPSFRHVLHPSRSSFFGMGGFFIFGLLGLLDVALALLFWEWRGRTLVALALLWRAGFGLIYGLGNCSFGLGLGNCSFVLGKILIETKMDVAP